MIIELLERIWALLAAIENDEAHHGGLLSRETLRRASEVRRVIAKLDLSEE